MLRRIVGSVNSEQGKPSRLITSSRGFLKKFLIFNMFLAVKQTIKHELYPDESILSNADNFRFLYSFQRM